MYTRKNPFHAILKEKYLLNRPGSTRKTYHLVLDLQDTQLDYCVGDSIGILPSNILEVVSKTMQNMGISEDPIVEDRRTKQQISLRDFLSTKANISRVPSSLLKKFHVKQENKQKKEELGYLLQPENKSKMLDYLHSHELWDLLKEHREAYLSPQEICDCLLPLMPRFYSIANSPLETPYEIHLTVGYVSFETSGHTRIGVGSYFLCKFAKEGETPIPIYVQPSNGFSLPMDNQAPIIMIGPGTGIAPFRGFIQERIKTNATGKNWLFFGERNKNYDFYYEDYWNNLQKKINLRLDTAFSRDQNEKIYVQHKLLENAPEIWKWINEGAYIYLCGDAQKMAKDVDVALQTIAKNQGKMTEEDSRKFFKEMRREKRYLMDVY